MSWSAPSFCGHIICIYLVCVCVRARVFTWPWFTLLSTAFLAFGLQWFLFKLHRKYWALFVFVLKISQSVAFKVFRNRPGSKVPHTKKYEIHILFCLNCYVSFLCLVIENTLTYPCVQLQFYLDTDTHFEGVISSDLKHDPHVSPVTTCK